MILERSDYFKLVNGGKLLDLSGEVDMLEDRANDFISDLIATIKRVMMNVYNVTKCDKLLLGREEPMFTLKYVGGKIYVTIESGCSSNVGQTYNIDELNSLEHAERLSAILSWLV